VQNVKNQYRALLLLFASLIIGQLILAMVLYFLLGFSKPIVPSFYQFFGPILLLFGMLWSRVYYNYKVRQLKSNLRTINNSEILDVQEENFSTREITNWFSQFKFLKTVQLYTIGSCNVIALMVCLFTNSKYSFLYFFVGMTYFALINPFLVNFYNDFNLTENEKKQIENQLKN